MHIEFFWFAHACDFYSEWQAIVKYKMTCAVVYAFN